MTELLTAAQMRAIEQAAIESGAVTGLELMERAGAGVVEAIFEEWPELEGPAPVAGAGGEYLDKDETRRAVVLCGPGNNGGDGFVVARLLKERGWAVEVVLYGDPDKLPPDARVNYERWLQLGEVRSLEDSGFDGWTDEGSGISLVLDALFGTGLTRPFLEFRHLSMTLNTCSSLARTRGAIPKVVAIDVPSGLCADSGIWLGDDQPLDFANTANLTVSFHTSKLGHVLADGPGSCGKTIVKSIGLEGRPRSPGEGEAHAGGRCRGLPGVPSIEIVDLLEQPSDQIAKSSDDHKYTQGHALIVSGGSGKTGAARLTARGALRIGAGLVTLGVPGSAQMEVAVQITALMMRRVDDADGLADVLTDKRLNALCLGPGLGLDRAKALVPEALKSGRKTVLDADALSAFADAPDGLFDVLHPACVLTPHGGEFARLFPDIAARLSETPTKGPAYSKVDATRAAAERAGCIVLYKGPDTVIAAPDGRCAINAAVYDRAAPWLATAGSGDVLAGIVTGLLARGFDPFMAAGSGAWLHVEAARAFGPGLIAEDLPEMLPQVFRDLGV